MIKIQDLKVGDRVKYKIKNPRCGTNCYTTIEKDGIILAIHDKFFQIENHDYYNKQISVYPEEIISQLKCVYAETPIEKERPAPKIYKFDGNLKKVSWDYEGCLYGLEFDDCKKYYNEMLRPGKEYTVEIKEKE
jgi:hypothetical protein